MSSYQRRNSYNPEERKFVNDVYEELRERCMGQNLDEAFLYKTAQMVVINPPKRIRMNIRYDRLVSDTVDMAEELLKE